MEVFYIALTSTFVLGLGARKFKIEEKKPLLLFSIIIMAIFMLVSGLRSGIGDTSMYKHLYGMVVDGTIDKDAYEKGFIFFLELLSKICKDSQFMIIITSIITQGLNIWFLRRYSSYFELELFMYISSGYFLTIMNGIRQGLAAALLLVGTNFLIKRKFFPYLIITLLISTIHTSALVMIPVYFIVNNDNWSKNFVKTMVVLVILVGFGGVIMKYGIELLEGTRYEVYSEFDEGGSNIVRTLVATVPVIMAYLQRNNLRKVFPECDIFVNLSIINMFIMGLSLYNWIFARISYYFVPYTFVLLPYIIKSIEDKSHKRLIYYTFLVAYFGFMYVEYVVTLNMKYISILS